MAKEGFFENIKIQIGLKEGDTILHIYNKKTNFSKFFSDLVGEKGKIYVIDVNSLKKKNPKKNIVFATVKENLDIKTGSIDTIFLEDTIYLLTDFYNSLSGIKKYLSEKGKLVINQKKELIPFHYLKRKKLREGIYTSGFRLKNRLNLNNGSFLDIFEKE